MSDKVHTVLVAEGYGLTHTMRRIIGERGRAIVTVPVDDNAPTVDPLTTNTLTLHAVSNPPSLTVVPPARRPSKSKRSKWGRPR